MSDQQSRDRRIIEVLQEPLALDVNPFAEHARRLGVTEENVVALLKEYIDRGVIRRVAGVLKHDRAGFTCNAMVVFDVEEGACDKAGETAAGFPFVSHCYRRTPYRDWPYVLYAMVHARDRQELDGSLAKLREAIPCRSMLVLPSVTEYKKTTFHPRKTSGAGPSKAHDDPGYGKEKDFKPDKSE